jgi:hydroxypyruvate reductase
MTASGPFANIDIPVGEARAIIKRYNIEQDVPEAIMTFLHQEQIESEKNVYVSQYILSDNDMLVSSIKQRAELKGYHVESSVNMQGDVKEAAAHICKTIQDYVNDVPTLFVWGGETTIPIMGGPIGIGGRNQEFVLHCLKYFRENPVSYDWCVASIATDGVDHIPESCGGIVDNVSLLLLEKAKNNLNDVLNTHNAYAFLSEIGGNVYVKGQTNTNVGDIVMCMTAPK